MRATEEAAAQCKQTVGYVYGEGRGHSSIENMDRVFLD
jgi:hypothetical protein